MPAFEGLFPPPHDSLIQDLLYLLGSWHGVAKLRMHTESTLATLNQLTQRFGSVLRKFKRVTCAAFTTTELPKEATAHARRVNVTSDRPSHTAKPLGVQHQKTINLRTYKLHAMGDYVHTIRRYGTVDSYSTQVVSSYDLTLDSLTS